MIPVMKKYDSAAATLELIPAPATPAAGTGGVAGAPADEAGDPQTLQNAVPSETADPHLEQNAIFPPLGLDMYKTTQSIAQNPFSTQ